MNTPRPSNRNTKTSIPILALRPLSSVLPDLDPPVRTHSALHTHKTLPTPSTLTANLTHMRHTLHDLTTRISALEASIYRTYSSISGLPSPPLSPPLPNHIQRFHDAEGQPYYANHLTQTTSWENPLKGKGKEEGRPHSASHATRMTRWQSPLLVGEEGDGEDAEREGGEGEGETGKVHDPRARPTHRPPSPTLPPHITRDYDESGRPYYSNHTTRTTSWFNPLNPLPTPRPSPRHPADPASNALSHPSDHHPHSHPPVSSSSSSSPATGPPLPAHSAAWHDPRGRTFYADRTTGTTTWLHPGKVAEALERKRKWGTDAREVTVDGRGVYWVDHERGGVTEVVALEGMEGREEGEEGEVVRMSV